MKLCWELPSSLGDGVVGYARANQGLYRGLVDAGAEMIDWFDDSWDWRVAVTTPNLWLVAWPGEYVPDFCLHTMFDCDLLPDRWARAADRAGLLWVPSQWCKETFLRSGIRRPIMVSGYGVDGDMFRFREKGWDKVRFMCDAQVNGDRKNWRMAAHALTKLNLRDAELVVKISFKQSQRINDPRIIYMDEMLPDDEWAHLMASANCFVYASSGEGFGLMPLEAMSCGACVIATDYSGMTEYLSDDDNLRLRYRLVDAELYNRGNLGEGHWAHPDFDDLCDKMQWVYDHRDEAAEMGRRAAARVRRDWTWQQAGEKALKLLEEHM